MWLSGGETREKWFKFKFQPGQLLEGHVRDDHGKEQGTVLVEVKKMISTSEHGHVIQAGYVAASDPHYRWWMTSGAGDCTTCVRAFQWIARMTRKEE